VAAANPGTGAAAVRSRDVPGPSSERRDGRLPSTTRSPSGGLHAFAPNISAHFARTVWTTAGKGIGPWNEASTDPAIGLTAVALRR
jgi:hypothetical protein